MIATATVNDEDTVRSTSPAPLQAAPRVGFLAQWGRRISTVPSVASSITSSAVNAATTSTFHTSCAESCERCDELKAQSKTNQSMLNDCATELKIKEAEAETVKAMFKKLQAQLDQADIKLCLEQARFDRELQSKDKQLAVQIAESKMHTETSNELAAQLTKQHEKLTSFEAKLKAKDDEIEGLQGKLKEQDAAGNEFKAEAKDKITQLGDSLCRLQQVIEEEAAKRAAEPQLEYKKQFAGDLMNFRARIAHLEAENEKLHTQLSSEEDLDDDESFISRDVGCDGTDC